MSKNLSLATTIEKNQLASTTPFLVLLAIDVIDPGTGLLVETARIVRNTENITFQGNVFEAGNFEIDFKAEAGKQPTVTLSVRDYTKALQARMQAYGGGIGFAVQVIVVNAGNLTQKPEISENFQVIGAQAQDYDAQFTLGAENALMRIFPRRKQTKDFCQWRYKSPDCGYRDPRYVSLPGTAGNYVRTPDTVATSITGDLDLRVQAALTDWTPVTEATVLSKWTTVSNQRGYALNITTTGNVKLVWSPDGISALIATSTAVLSLANNAIKWVRAVIDVNNGASGRTVTFYTSNDGTSWAQHGDAVVQAGITSIFNGTAFVEIGTHTDGTAGFTIGKVYRGQIFNAATGLLVADFDPAIVAGIDPLSFTAITGEVWSIMKSGSPSATVLFDGTPKVDCDLSLQGLNGCAAHNNTINFGGFPGINRSNVRYG